MTLTIRIALLVLLAALGAQASARDLLARIAKDGQINLGYSETSPPFSFKHGGAPMGYSVELCQAVAERIRQVTGQPQLRVNLVPVDPDQVPRVVGSALVDVMCGAISDTPLRRRTMSFSSPIFLSPTKLLVMADGPRAVADLKGQTVAVFGRTTTELAVAHLSRTQTLSLKMSRVVSSEAALSQLRLKQAVAWARDEVLLLGAISSEPDAAQFRLLDDVLSTEVIALALPLDDKLAQVVDAAVAEEIRSGRMEALYDKWFVQPNPSNPRGLKLPMSPALKAEFAKRR